MWVGTEEGLARFNGVEFSILNTENSSLINNFVFRLYESSDSTLWIGTKSGLSAFRNGRFTNYTTKEGLSSNNISHILESADHRLWVGTDNGLCFIQEGQVTRIEANFADNFIISLAGGQNREIFVGTRKGLYIYRDGQVYPHPSPATTNSIIRALWVDLDGSLWAGLGREGLLKLDKASTTRPQLIQGSLKDVNWAIRRDKSNVLWVATKRGLVGIDEKGKVQLTYKDGLSSDDIQSLYEDREGNLWVGTLGGGLNSLTRSKFITLLTGVTPNQNQVYTVSEDQFKTLWVGNAAGQVLMFNGGGFKPHRGFDRIANISVYSVLHDSATGLWVGTRKGVYRYRNGKTENIPLQGDTAESVRALLKDRDGSIWIGARNGLYRFAGNKIEAFNINSGLPSANIRTIYEDRGGNLWIGTNLGLSKRSHGIFSTVISAEDSTPKQLGPVYEDKEGTLWVGSIGEGLIRVKDGSIFQYTKAHGLYDNTAYAILEDNVGNLWVSCNNGVYRVSKKNLNDVAEERTPKLFCKPYGEDDGMLSSECNGGNHPAGWKTKDGKLWFPTLAGVVTIDPRTVPLNTTIPPVFIETVLTEREPLKLTNGVQISPGKNTIEFQFACLSFRSPAVVQFRYQLVGHDRGWIDGGSRRFAQYTNLSPGEYTFRVIASNDDGIWNETGASFSFELRPFFYQTYWFYSLIAILLILFGAGVQRLYHRFRQRELLANQLQAQVARAQLQALRSQLNPHFLFNALNAISGLIMRDPRMAVRMMARMSDFLRLTLDSELLQKIPLHSELDSLQKYVEIEQLRLGNRLSVSYDVSSDALQAYVPSLLLQPLVENSIRHGIAKKPHGGSIAIRIRVKHERLEIEVSDDGIGMNASLGGPLREGVGLTNTRARLLELYGSLQSLEIVSTPEGGTQVVLSIPLEHATIQERESA